MKFATVAENGISLEAGHIEDIRLFAASLRKKGMADIPEAVYPAGFSKDTGGYTIWEQPSR